MTFRDPQAPGKVKPGLYVRVFFPTLSSAEDVFAGDHLWLLVESIDRNAGTFKGVVLANPKSQCGVKRRQTVEVKLVDAEEVSSAAP